MRRGTTPKHTFQLPLPATELKELKITYAQSGKTVLHKYKEDCIIDGANVVVTLTQEETLKFNVLQPCQIQVRALTEDDNAIASKIMTTAVLPLLDSEVLA